MRCEEGRNPASLKDSEGIRAIGWKHLACAIAGGRAKKEIDPTCAIRAGAWRTPIGRSKRKIRKAIVIHVAQATHDFSNAVAAPETFGDPVWRISEGTVTTTKQVNRTSPLDSIAKVWGPNQQVAESVAIDI